MDKIPFKEQRIINELIVFWQTGKKPRDLVIHIDPWNTSSERRIGTSFFWQVYEDLLTDKRSKYAAFSASEFKQFLEIEYRRLDQANEEYERRARSDFDALGKEMEKATTRAELAEIGRKRADLAPHTGVSYMYTTHCWKCKKHISPAIHAQCSACRFYICSSCGSCFCGSLNY